MKAGTFGRGTRAMAVAVVSGTLLAGLSAGSAVAADPSTTAKATTTTAAVATKIPAGTTIKVGDQLDYLKTVLSMTGQDKGLPYSVDYSAFIGGPPMIQAFQAGSIDAGLVGSTPLIFAQAANQDIKAVAAWANTGGSYGLLTSPGSNGIKGWKSLKGKKVTYQQGTAGEAAVLEGLADAKLQLSDITPVNLPITQAATALQGGSADAGLLVEPLTSAYIAKNAGAKEVARSTAITDRSSFLIATKHALGDKAKQAALGDYITRLVKAFAYLQVHPELTIENVYEKQYGLTPERAAEVAKQTGPTSFLVLPGKVLKAQQRLANLFLAAGEIPAKVNVKQEFDPRYNATVKAAQAAPAASAS